jgi:MYXO-CTERM domain-containing protein
MIVEALAADPKSPTSVGGGAPLGTMALTGMLVLAMFAAARQRFRTSG